MTLIDRNGTRWTVDPSGSYASTRTSTGTVIRDLKSLRATVGPLREAR